jgi:hypothetical protein
MKVHLIDGRCQGEHDVQDDLAVGDEFEVECLDGAASVDRRQETPRADQVRAKYRLTSLGPPALAEAV